MILPVNYDETPSMMRRLVRQEYAIKQEGKCYYCNESLDGNPESKVLRKSIMKEAFPIGFFKNPIHLHHDHTTGMTLGAVHAHCNAVLWQYHGE